MAEAGLFPGVNYYLSCWYKRSEFGIRAAVFFSAAAISGSFGGLLAAAIAKMKGVGGLPGWAWIFVSNLCLSSLQLLTEIRFSKALLLFSSALLHSGLCMISPQTAPSLVMMTRRVSSSA